MYWITIVPPYRTKGTKPDVIYSRQRPPWAKVAKGRHSPRKTVHPTGKLPSLIELPMGVTTARVKKGRKLRFTRRNGKKRKSS